MLREINGILRQTNLPDESEEYLLKRDELRRAEIDLRKQRERVAELRRQLPEVLRSRNTSSRKSPRNSMQETRRSETYD